MPRCEVQADIVQMHYQVTRRRIVPKGFVNGLEILV